MHTAMPFPTILKVGTQLRGETIKSTLYGVMQGLLELLWTVYSQGKLQSCLTLRNFQNPFNKDKSVGL